MAVTLDAARWDTHLHVFAGAVRKGSHYSPSPHSLAMWSAVATPCGITRALLVQPSVYGTDNSALLGALRESGGVHRGVVVIDTSVSDADLEAMHAAGVRGIRFNLVSPVGSDTTNIDAIIARVRPLGWHAQFFLTPADYTWMRAQLHKWRVPIVLDHLGNLQADEPQTEALAALVALGDQGAWLKVSGFYRLGVTQPFATIDTLIEKLYPSFAGRMLWGSDWPHTWYMEPKAEVTRGEAPDYATLLAPLVRVFQQAAMQQAILVDAPAKLYA